MAVAKPDLDKKVYQSGRMALIRNKNVAFDALNKATVECYKRSKRGPLPVDWGVRLAELEVEYRRALRALGKATLN